MHKCLITIKINSQYKIACIMVTGEDTIIGGVVTKELKATTRDVITRDLISEIDCKHIPGGIGLPVSLQTEYNLHHLPVRVQRKRLYKKLSVVPSECRITVLLSLPLTEIMMGGVNENNGKVCIIAGCSDGAIR